MSFIGLTGLGLTNFVVFRGRNRMTEWTKRFPFVHTFDSHNNIKPYYNKLFELTFLQFKK